MTKPDLTARAEQLVTLDGDGYAWTVFICGYSIRTYTHAETAKQFRAELIAAIASALQEVVEECAKVAEEWRDSLEDIDCGAVMVSVLKHGKPDAEGGICITPADKLEPWEKDQAATLAEFREVARREEHRIIAAAIRRRGE